MTECDKIKLLIAHEMAEMWAAWRHMPLTDCRRLWERGYQVYHQCIDVGINVSEIPESTKAKQTVNVRFSPPIQGRHSNIAKYLFAVDNNVINLIEMAQKE